MGLLLAALLFALFGTPIAQATLLDTTAGLGQFNYANNAAFSAQYFTTGGNGANSGPVYLTASAMTRLGYNSGFGFFPASAAGLNFPSTSGNANKIRTHLLSSGSGGTASGTVYMSFLLRVNSAPGSTRGLFSLASNTGSQAQVNKSVWAMINSSGQIAISKSSVTVADATLTTTNLTGTGVHLVVMAYTFVGAVASDDSISLWLDPANSTFGAAEGSLPATSLTFTGGTDADAIRCVVANAGPASSGGNIDVDEVRVGTAWADVLPTPTTCVAPVVANTSPASITTNENLTVTLTSTLTAGDNAGVPTALQWQRWDSVSTWTNLVNATNSSYTTPPLLVANDNGAQYRLFASIACNSSSTNSATNTLTVIACDNVAITTSPGSGTIATGSSTNLSVVVSGSLPIYQWQRWDGVSTFTNIPGATASTYTTPVLFIPDSGVQFRCAVSSGCNASSTNSGVAAITVVCGTPTVAANPASTTTTVGAPAIFTVGYSGPAPTYQWQSSTDGGFIYGDLSGETYSSYTNLSAVLASPSLRYRCILTACSSTATSTPAILTVVAPSAAKYRSVASGNWSAPATWQMSVDGGTTWTNTYAPPSDANDTIQVRSPNNVTADSSFSIDQATVDSGGILNVSSNNTLTIAGTGTQLDVSGILLSAGTVTPTGALVFESGGKYQHNRTSLSGGIPTATWNPGSTCEVIGFTTVNGEWTAGNLGQAFYNFTWNCTNYVGSGVALEGNLTTVNGNFTHSNGRLTLGSTSSATPFTLTVSNNAVFTAPSGFGNILLAGVGFQTCNLNIGGNLTVASGTFVDPFAPSFTTISFFGANCVYTNGASTRWNGNEKTLTWHVASGAKLTLQTAIASGSTLASYVYGITVDGTLDVNGKECFSLNLLGASTGRITNSGAACKLNVGYGTGGGLFNTPVSLPGQFNGVIAGAISLVKQGNTTVTLAGTNTYTGTTTVTNGVLLVSGSLGAASAVTVADSGTLSGSTIGGNVTVNSGGTLAPGTGLGPLTIGGNLALGGNLAVEVNKSVSPFSDLCFVNGALTNTGGGWLTVENLGPALAVGDSFTLFNQPLLSSTPLPLPITPAPGPGLTWSNTLAIDGTITVVSNVVGTYTETLYAVTESSPSRLISFQNNAPGNLLLNVELSTTIYGIEFVGETLYGVGSGSLYTIDRVTGATTLVGNFTPVLNGAGFGVSAEPTGLRVVSDLDQQLLLNYGNGAATVGTTIVGGGATTVSGMAYHPGTGVRYVVDTDSDTFGTLDPATGLVSTLGGLSGNDFSRRNGFAISSKPAYTAYMVSAAGSSGTAANLYTIDSLETGGSTLVGLIGSGDPGYIIRGLAVSPDFSTTPSVNSTPTNLTSIVTGGTNLTLAWPSTHLGWTLQMQTNSRAIGLKTNWLDVTGSTSMTATNFPINKTDPTVFFRLKLSVP